MFDESEYPMDYKKMIFFILTLSLITGQNLFAGSIEDYIILATNEVRYLSSDSCALQLKTIKNNMDALQESFQLKTDSQLQVETLRSQLFTIRRELHSQLKKINANCVLSIKETLVSSRALEDLVGLYGYNDTQLEFEKVDFQKQPTPLMNTSAYRSHHGQKEIRFLAGDIMITKGISFISSAISFLPDPTSLFSHIVFVDVDQTRGTARTIESYIGANVSTYDMDFALKNENARILVLRQNDPALGKKANDYLIDRINFAKNRNQTIPYDYALDFDDNSQMSCEEIAFDAYKYASDGQFLLPAYPSVISRNSVSILSSIGLKKGPMMTPADMESDPRFEVIYDWTDYRFLRDSWRKDAILSEIFRWIDNHHYQFRTNLTDVPRNILLGLRNIPGLSWLINTIKDIDPNLPNGAIITKINLQLVGALLISELKKNDEVHFQKTGLWMSQRQLRNTLEKIRLKDLAKHRNPLQRSQFHDYFNSEPAAYRQIDN